MAKFVPHATPGWTAYKVEEEGKQYTSLSISSSYYSIFCSTLPDSLFLCCDGSHFHQLLFHHSYRLRRRNSNATKVKEETCEMGTRFWNQINPFQRWLRGRRHRRGEECTRIQTNKHTAELLLGLRNVQRKRERESEIAPMSIYINEFVAVWRRRYAITYWWQQDCRWLTKHLQTYGVEWRRADADDHHRSAPRV